MKSHPEWLPQQMPTLLINRLARLVSKEADESLRDVGLTIAQLPVLVSLKDGAKLTQKELADLTGVEQPSMAQLLSRMERDGMIQRTPSPIDKRSSLVSLTGQATKQLEPGRSALRKVDDEFCSVLTQDERNVLTGLLQRLLTQRE